MARILACCANGSGTSLMMKLTLDKVISTCGFKVEEARHDSIMEGRKVAADYDIVHRTQECDGAERNDGSADELRDRPEGVRKST